MENTKKRNYFIFFKPYGVLSQFTPSEGKETLADYGPFPGDVYPVGRLDYDSEGLLLLTNDGILQHLLLEPKFGHSRTYLAQIEKIPGEEALEKLRSGVLIDEKITLPATVELLDNDLEFPERSVPIRVRKSVPTAWLKITLTEGRNRQVRRMAAAVGHPTLRLIRISFANLTIEDLLPGEHRMLTSEELTDLKKMLSAENKSRKILHRRR